MDPLRSAPSLLCSLLSGLQLRAGFVAGSRERFQLLPVLLPGPFFPTSSPGATSVTRSTPETPSQAPPSLGLTPYLQRPTGTELSSPPQNTSGTPAQPRASPKPQEESRCCGVWGLQPVGGHSTDPSSQPPSLGRRGTCLNSPQRLRDPAPAVVAANLRAYLLTF